MPGMRLPPGEPMIMRPFGPSTNVGVDDDSGRFFGRDRIGIRADELEAVRHAGLRREIVHLVVQQDAGAGDHEPRAEEEVERDAWRRPCCRSCRSPRNEWFECPAGAASTPGSDAARRGAIHADRGALAGGVVVVDEPLDGHVDEIRIAEIDGAIAMHAAHGFDDEMRARHLVDLRRGRSLRGCSARRSARCRPRWAASPRRCARRGSGRPRARARRPCSWRDPPRSSCRRAAARRRRASSRTRPCRSRRRPWWRAARGSSASSGCLMT